MHQSSWELIYTRNIFVYEISDKFDRLKLPAKNKQCAFIYSKFRAAKIELLEIKNSDGILSEHAHSLVPVFLDSIAEGRPRRYGLICLPNSEDLENVNIVVIIRHHFG